MTTLKPRLTTSDLADLMRSRIVVFDGAMGTQLQARDLTAKDFGGEAYLGCNEHLVVTRPDVVADVHRDYYAAGADFVETNTFGGTPFVLGEYGLQDQAIAINRAAATIAREVAATFSDKPRFVAGSMGPTTKSISVTAAISFDELAAQYAVQAEGLLLGGIDVFLLETAIDTLNLKAGIVGIRRAQDKLGFEAPLMVSATIEQMGTMLAGQSAEALHASLEHAGLVSIGLNCATGPDPMADHVRALAEMSPFSVTCMPNAGLPDEDGKYGETAQTLAKKLARFCEHGFLNMVGACCGTTPAHIKALAEMAQAYQPRSAQKRVAPAVSGVDYLDLEQTRPVIVGERTNVIGSRAFKRLIVEGKWDEAAEIGRKQVRGGAHVVDVCLANPDRDEKADVITFLDQLSKKVRAPLMIDSTDAEVIEEALKRTQGKAIVNSINLEDGEERFEVVCPLLRRYGGAVVVGCIDEDPQQGMGVTRQRKLGIARRSYELLTQKYGVKARDIIFDPLVFPCGTGDAQYMGSAKETIEGVRLIKAVYPECKTILGISNVSFGLPDSGREALNTVFLHKNFEAGLDMAIVNAEKLERITHLPPEEVRLCEELLEAGPDKAEAALTAFVAHFAQKSGTKRVASRREGLPLDERLALSVVEGSREGLIEDLDIALKDKKPLDIVNGPLMAGMAEVGRLFGANQLIVAEVLQSAEVMKAAVSHLEKFMEKSDVAAKAVMLLATVKGDVHDIGKNLVDIILSNNGFKVVNLGIKVPPAALIAAVKQHKPDFIGLSGLLVKSAQEMVSTADELSAAGINLPILVGGAALTERFTYGRIHAKYPTGIVAYARDAMTGLDLANRLFDAAKRPALEEMVKQKRVEAEKPVEPPSSSATFGPAATKVTIDHTAAPPRPPDTALHVVDDVPLEVLWTYVNPMMLYARHLGLKGKIDDLIKAGDPKAIELKRIVKGVEDRILGEGLLRARAVYKFFPTKPEGDALLVDGTTRIDFPRMKGGEERCLADLVAPANDHVAMFVTTCQGTGKSVRELAEELKEKGEYLTSHALSAIAIETAEAMAEWLHQKLRQMWGFPDDAGLSKQDLFSARYRGKRYSFGYPACPRLDDQAQLFSLLDPAGHIGVELTEGFMMDPEASVSALVFSHPQAAYFSVGATE